MARSSGPEQGGKGGGGPVRAGQLVFQGGRITEASGSEEGHRLRHIKK